MRESIYDLPKFIFELRFACIYYLAAAYYFDVLLDLLS